jgi:RNA polymerase sigma-70 factor (ECF subfamily)
MALHPSKALHFESWDELLRWLPKASESQLITVFVWAGDYEGSAKDVRQLAAVRTEAFEQLVVRTQERLKRFLIQRCQCRDVHLADDVVQQVLIKLYLRAEQFDPQRSFWGWLYRVARHQYIDALRRIRPGDVGIGQVGQTEGDLDEWLQSRAQVVATPDREMVYQESLQQIEKAIDALPHLQRTIVRLKREGMKGKDIAARLKISQAYVSQMYHEAGELLREALEG